MPDVEALEIELDDDAPAFRRRLALVVVLVTGVLVSPNPMPANRQPGSMVSQLACSAPLPALIRIKPVPIVNRPSGMTTPG